MGHERPLNLTADLPALVPGPVRHVTEEGILRDDSGAYSAECMCGFEAVGFVAIEDVADALMEHAYVMGLSAGRAGR